DGSYPERETTFFGGTYSQHPLALTAARTVLRHLGEHGPGLQEEVNQRTDRFVGGLNEYFESERVPIRIVHCGSQFRFRFAADADLLFYHLLEKGVYVWEWRNCFLSTAHTDEDLEQVTAAVRESIEELRAGGFLPASPRRPAGPATKTAAFPLTVGQKELFTLTELDPAASVAYNEPMVLRLAGLLRWPALAAALRHAVARHEALRTIFPADREVQEVRAEMPVELPLVDFAAIPAPERHGVIRGVLRRTIARPFDLARGPLVRSLLLRLAADQHLLAVTCHHLVIDGVSVALLMRELVTTYAAAGRACALGAPFPFRRYAAWLEQDRQATATADEAYWRVQFAEPAPVFEPPTDRPRPAQRGFRGRRQRTRL
ncbi:MAG: non-ribosomal peptide synthetase, partial [bacterium]|nr:non-ribosomal peptide synthetase [bacterium]